MESMNCQRASKILEIDEPFEIVSIEVVRKQYKILALKWHPDRNKAPNAAEKYREIKDAHDYLLDMSSNREYICEDNSYNNIASMFFETLYNNEDFQRRIFHPLLMKVATMCEEKALAFILRLDANRATKLLATIEIYKTTLHFSDTFFDKVRMHISGSCLQSCDRHIILNPNIDDLMHSNVCFLRDEGIVVPLWHSLLEYEKEGITVHCLPELPDNMWIDDNETNVLNVEVEGACEHIWKTGFLEFSIGTEKKRIEKNILRMCAFQIVELVGEGIPVPHADDVWGNREKSAVRVHLKMY